MSPTVYTNKLKSLNFSNRVFWILIVILQMFSYTYQKELRKSKNPLLFEIKCVFISIRNETFLYYLWTWNCMFVNSPEKHIIYPDPDLKILDLDPSSVVKIHQKVKRIYSTSKIWTKNTATKSTFWKIFNFESRQGSGSIKMKSRIRIHV